MTRYILAILLSVMTFTANAQTDKEQKIIQRVSNAASELKSMQCDFVQTKSLKMLGDKMVSKGKMYFQQSNKLHWEYISPYTYTFILNGNKVLLKKGNRKDVIDVNQNKIFREIVQIMMNSIMGKCLTDSKSFKVSVAESSNEYVATMIPQKKEMKQMYTKIELHLNRNTVMVNKVVMYAKNGDNTVIELKNVIQNKPINAKVFEF